MKDVIIIGAGAIGSFLARELRKYELNVVLIEKNPDVAFETSIANSGIIHSGYDPKENTLKASLNVLGNKMFDKLSDDLDFEFKRIGSITLARNEEEKETLKLLADRAKNNGVEVRLLSSDEVHELEPNLSSNVIAGLLAPTAGIVDPFTMVAHTVENFVDNKGELLLNTKVVDVVRVNDHFKVVTSNAEIEAKIVINAAGLYADEIARLVNKDFDLKIVPKKGEYFLLEKMQPVCKHTLFNVPSKLGKGVLITPTTSFNTLIGPNNVLADSKDDVSVDADSLSGIQEKARLNVKNTFLHKTIKVFAGNRASIENGYDFYIQKDAKYDNFINLIGIDSPGLTASPAIAEYVVKNFIKPIIELKENKSFNPKIKKYLHPYYMDEASRNELVSKHPEYGKYVCNCEYVTLGEVLDVFSRSVPVTTIKGLKNRTRMGFGICQAGFCQPNILGLLKNRYNIELTDINYSNEGSYIVERRAK